MREHRTTTTTTQHSTAQEKERGKKRKNTKRVHKNDDPKGEVGREIPRQDLRRDKIEKERGRRDGLTEDPRPYDHRREDLGRRIAGTTRRGTAAAAAATTGRSILEEVGPFVRSPSRARAREINGRRSIQCIRGSASLTRGAAAKEN